MIKHEIDSSEKVSIVLFRFSKIKIYFKWEHCIPYTNLNQEY